MTIELKTKIIKIFVFSRDLRPFKLMFISKCSKIFLYTIIIFAGFVFFNVSDANATWCVYQEKNTSTGAEVSSGIDNWSPKMTECNGATTCNEDGSFGGSGAGTRKCWATNDKSEADKYYSELKTDAINQNTTDAENALTDKNALCAGLKIFSVDVFKCLLLYVLKCVGYFVQAASTLLGWVLNADNMKNILSNNIIFNTWKNVRDVLNIFFIFAMLFCAFASIFQVSKFNYKNFLLTIILMALLVNFSFPIARFIIDVSNVIMYYLIKSIGLESEATTFGSTMANKGGLQDLLSPGGKSSINLGSDMSLLIAAVVFMFIFAVSILAIGVLLLIRIIVLAILIIFSPIAFAGSIIPFLSSHAGKWWDSLFKYSFFGPIVIFMMKVALDMMTAIANNANSMQSVSASMSGGEISKVIASMAFFSIPIVILWIGIGFSQQMSIFGASAVVGRAQRFAQGVGRWAVSRPHKIAGWGIKKTGIPGGVKQGYTDWKKRGFLGSDRQTEREAKWAARFGSKGSNEALDAKKTKEAKEKHDTENMATYELRNLAKNGSRHEKAAAIQELANRGQATQKDLDEMRGTFGETSQVFRQLATKVKSYDPVAAFAHITDDAERMTRTQEFINSSQFDVKKIGANSLQNADFTDMLFANNAISAKDVMELSKNPDKAAAIKSSLAKLVVDRDVNSSDDKDMASKINRQVHLANFAATGEVANADFAEHIFKTMDKDMASKMTSATVTAHADTIANNINSGQYKNIIQNMKDNAARKALNDHIAKNTTFTPGSNADTIQKIIKNDQFLNNL
jgi:hypothetical protein